MKNQTTPTKCMEVASWEFFKLPSGQFLKMFKGQAQPDIPKQETINKGQFLGFVRIFGTSSDYTTALTL